MRKVGKRSYLELRRVAVEMADLAYNADGLRMFLRTKHRDLHRIFTDLAKGNNVELEVGERVILQPHGRKGIVEHEWGVERGFEEWGTPLPMDPTILEVFRVFGDRFRVCRVCGHGFFKFGRAKYCGPECSRKGRKEEYRLKVRLQSPPRRLLSKTQRHVNKKREVEDLLREVREYLLQPRVWGQSRLGAQLNNPQEAESAVNEALFILSQEIQKGAIKHPKAYARKILRQVAPRHWQKFMGGELGVTGG